MKKKSPYKANQKRIIYKDWENEKDPIGTARLLKLQSLGRSFILEDTMPEKEQIVYNYETWVVNINGTKKLHKLRFVDSIGIANSKEDTIDDDMSDAEYNKLPVDKFIEINGKSIY